MDEMLENLEKIVTFFASLCLRVHLITFHSPSFSVMEVDHMLDVCNIYEMYGKGNRNRINLI